jgi:citrate lyase synthetase
MIAHIPTYNTLPVNFISGLVFAWTYEKTGSILPAIIIHASYNGIAFILTLISWLINLNVAKKGIFLAIVVTTFFVYAFLYLSFEEVRKVQRNFD